MVNSIYKYPLFITDRQLITVPKGSVPLAVQYQRTTLCLWVWVDKDEPSIEQLVYVYGTGNPILEQIEDVKYVGTAQDPILPLVWHVFWGK